MGQPIHHSLRSVMDYPYTISYAIRKRMQYDSFLELPKDKQPPDNIWDIPEEIDDWFEKVFDYKKGSPQTSITLDLDDIEG
jgi:hypothetical protein